MPKIFLAYRRADTQGYSGRLYDGLSAHWGKEQVTLDIYGIPVGVEYAAFAQQKVAESDCVLVLIGKRWTEATSLQRLADPEDLLRVEIQTALQTKRRVIPVLIEGARMPTIEELPNELHNLTKLNAFPIDDSGWNDDLRRLINDIEASTPGRSLTKHAWLGVRIVGAMIVIVLSAKEIMKPDARTPGDRPAQDTTGPNPAAKGEADSVPPMLGPYAAMSPAAEDVYYDVLSDGSVRFRYGWDTQNVIPVRVPQLAKIRGGPPNGEIRFYKDAIPDLLAAWAELERADLLERVISWDHAYVPRSTGHGSTTLHDHAMGTAFDINAQANRRGQPPAAAGASGSVRELVPILEKHGFRWGGTESSLDGMHFEWVPRDPL